MLVLASIDLSRVGKLTRPKTYVEWEKYMCPARSLPSYEFCGRGGTHCEPTEIPSWSNKGECFRNSFTKNREKPYPQQEFMRKTFSHKRVCPVITFVAVPGPIGSQQKSQVGPKRARVFETCLQRTRRSHILSHNLCKKHFSHKRVCPVLDLWPCQDPL